MELYEILNVKPDCSMTDIKKSYHKLAKTHHPDKMNGNSEKFQQINNAYTILIDEKSRAKYNIMNTVTKNKFILFMEKFFKDQPNIKSIFNMTDTMFDNIESYDFNDILSFFNNSIIPDKKNTDTIECSDSDIDSWDESQAEYYDDLPIKYYQYNKNNIKIELKCSIDEILKNSKRKIKINRLFFGTKQINTFHFNSTNKYIVYNQGGDNDQNGCGHLIICLILPTNYSIDKNNYIYNKTISLYEFIYGVNIKINFNKIDYDVKQWIPYRDGMLISMDYINNYVFVVQLNLNYIDTIDKKNILFEYFTH